MTHDEYVIGGALRRVVVVTRGGPGSGFRGHKGRPGEVGGSLPGGKVAQEARPNKVGGSLPKNDWRLQGFSAEEFTKDPNLPMEQMPELGKGMSIVYSNIGNKARWVAQVQTALERFRNATGIAPQGITITDHLPWMLWHGEPYEVLANMQGAEAEEIANVLVRGHFATSAGAYLPQGGPVIYIAPAGRKEEGFPDDTMAHELGHWLTMTAAPAALDAGITPTDRYVHRLIDSYGPGQIQGEYLADLFESLTRRGDRWAAGRFNSELLTATDLENRGILMDTVRHNLVLRTTKEQPGLMVLVLMGDEIVAVPEAELDDLPKGAIINPLYLWWEEHFQPKVELELDAKAFGWEAEDIAVQGEPEDGIFAVVEEVQRPKGRKETMAEAAGQEEPVSPGETPAPVPEQTPTEPQVKSALDVNVQGGDGDRILPSDVKGLFARFIEMLEKVRVPVVHVDVTPDIHFHAPEQPAPIVNLTLPETNVTVQPTLVVPPAEVTVNVPPHPKHMTERQTVKRSPDKTITEITGEREYWDDEEDTGG